MDAKLVGVLPMTTGRSCPPGGPIYVLRRGEETGGRVGFYDQVSAVGQQINARHQTHEDETWAASRAC